MVLSLWAESMPDAAVEAALPALSASGLGIGLSLPSERLGDRAFARLTRNAAQAGVSVRVWPLLPRERGYWIGEANVEETRELLLALLDWRAKRGGPVFEWVSFDLEPDYAYSESLRRAARRRPDKVLGMLSEHVRPTRFAKARASLARSVQTLRRAGVSAHAVTYPLVLDQREGDTTLEDALSIPVSGIDWDEVSFMVYQTPFAQLIGAWLGPALVSSYAKTAVARFGARAGIDLGIVGDHGVGIDPGESLPERSGSARRSRGVARGRHSPRAHAGLRPRRCARLGRRRGLAERSPARRGSEREPHGRGLPERRPRHRDGALRPGAAGVGVLGAGCDAWNVRVAGIACAEGCAVRGTSAWRASRALRGVRCAERPRGGHRVR
ncbi:MAG: hypothetical protein IPM35_26875 [Myxococcales bacterium]|nr:hypothetical protein [Myxococcales bacterium]